MLKTISIDLIARTAHELNRQYCCAIGDFTQPPWDLAPDWQQKSAIAGVEFHLANPNAGCAASHKSWLAEKEADGWKFGEVKDAEKKEHPCFVPYKALPAEQKVKDALFVGVVESMKVLLA